MTYPTPYLQAVRRQRISRGIALTVLLLAIATLLDGAVYHLLVMEKSAVEWRGWYQVLRQMGYAPTWLLVALGLVLHGRRRQADLDATDEDPRAKAGPLVLSMAVAGIAAELVKLLVGRERPTPTGDYAFKPFLGAIVDGSNLGFPSSHTAVAFGAAAAMAGLFPGIRWLMLALAAGCGLTRMLVGAHFLSDVVGGGAVGIASAAWALRVTGARKDPWS